MEATVLNRTEGQNEQEWVDFDLSLRNSYGWFSYGLWLGDGEDRCSYGKGVSEEALSLLKEIRPRVARLNEILEKQDAEIKAGLINIDDWE